MSYRCKLLMMLLLFCCLVHANIVLSAQPIWQVFSSNYPAGIGWADIDGNGWPNLIITYGLDVRFRPNYVYDNNGGIIDSTPGWVSSDSLPSDNIAIGDLDNDGDFDVVVSNLGQSSSGLEPLAQVIYYNNGGLSPLPDWSSPPANSFSCAIGDPDRDGDLDVAFAQGDYFTTQAQKSMVYFNEDGQIDTVPGWETDSSYYGVEIEFVDIDSDGDLDLALGARLCGVMIFYNHDGVLETTASWQTLAIVGGRQIDFGDVDNDGDLDMAVAAMIKGFYVFRNLGSVLETTPSWSCTTYVEPSCVAWADVDHDGDLDLAGGGWYTPVGIFENIGGSLTDSFVWSYSGGGLRTQIAWGDFDEDCVIDTVETFIGNGVQKLFYLRHKPLHVISSLKINSTQLTLDQYCYELTQGWISLSEAPAASETLCIEYQYSGDLDLAVTTTSNAMVFENQYVSEIEEEFNGSINYYQGNPTIVSGALCLPADRPYRIYDISGRAVVSDNLNPGVYFVEIEKTGIQKVVKVR
jgi:hypothetical protein